ncbi:MAG: hypothetical protein AAF358_17590 [Pseudomonadota bacterium]
MTTEDSTGTVHAKDWICAAQANSWMHIKAGQGAKHGLSEADYNQELAQRPNH